MSRHPLRARFAGACLLIVALTVLAMATVRPSSPTAPNGVATVNAAAVSRSVAAVTQAGPHTRDTPPTPFAAAAAKVERDGYVRRGRSGQIAAKGWVSVTQLEGDDDFAYVLHTKRGRFPLNLRDARVQGPRVRMGSPTIAPNSTVTVSGKSVKGAIKVSLADVVPNRKKFGNGLSPVATARQPGQLTRKVLVLRYQFAGDTAQPVSDAAIDNAFLNDSNALNHYYDVVSNGTLRFTVARPPYFTLTLARPTAAPGECSPANFNPVIFGLDEAYAKAVELGYNPASYDHIAYISDSGPGCGGRASAMANGNESYYPSYASLDGFVVSHETGHNLGMRHSDLLTCHARGAGVPMSDKCHSVQYGDRSDLMGNGQRQLTGFHAVQMGFVPTSNVAPIAAGATASMASVEVPSATSSPAQLLRYRRTSQPDPNAIDAWYYFDLRRAQGSFDNFPSGAPITRGVMIRQGTDVTTPAAQTRAINASPDRMWAVSGNARSNDGSVGQPAYPFDLATNAGYPDQDFALAVGQSFWDPVEDVTFWVQSLSSSATIKVTAGPPTSTGLTVSVAGSTLSVVAPSARRNVVAISSGQDDPAREASSGDVGLLHPPELMDVGDGQIVVSDSGNKVTPGAGCSAINALTVSCSKTSLRSIDVQLGDRDDFATVYEDVTIPVTFDGGAGRDVLNAGGGPATFLGGPGPQTGDALGVDADLFNGGPATDTVSYAGRTAPVSVTLSSSPWWSSGTDLANGDERDRIDSTVEGVIGGSGNDSLSVSGSSGGTLTGGPGKDSFVGGAGSDTIYARDGDATESIACGAGGSDKLFADGGESGSSCELPVNDPVVAVTSGPAAGSSVSETLPTFTFVAPFASNPVFRCKIEAGSTPGSAQLGVCGSSFQPPAALTQGMWTLSVVVQGAAASSTVTQTFRVDTTPPPTPTLVTPQGVYTSTSDSARFTVATNETGNRLECRLDGGEFRSCLANKAYKALTAGSHTFSVRSVDDAGNVSVPFDKPFTVDNTPPDTSFVGATPAEGSSVEPVFSFYFQSTEAGSSFRCAINDGAFSQCTSGISSGIVPPGPFKFSVRATDPAGNEDPSPVVRNLTVLPESLDTLITAGPQQGADVDTATPTFRFQSEPLTGYTFECRDTFNAQWLPCTSPYTPNLLPAGDNYVSVRAKEKATGRVDESPVTRSFFVVLSQPTARIDAGPAANSTIATSSTSFGFSAPGVTNPTFECKLDAEPNFALCTSTKSLTGLASGSHLFSVRAKTQSGTIGSVVSRRFTVDVPTVSQPTSPTPATVDLLAAQAPDGAPVDWIKWNTQNTTSFARKSGTPLIGALTRLPGGTSASLGGPTQFSWTNGVDAAGSPSSGTTATGPAVYGGLNGGFRFTVPATNASARTLRVWVSVRGVGVTGRLTAKFGSSSTELGGTLSATSDTVVTSGLYTVSYRPQSATDTLTVDWIETAGGSATTQRIAIQAAAVY